MAKTTSVTLRMDAQLKRKSEQLFDELGLNMTTAVTVFLKTAVRQGKIPFEIAYGKAELDAPAPDTPPASRDAVPPPHDTLNEGIAPELPDEPVWELDL